MVFLDVVYNHFGPDGQLPARYAPQFFREDHHTPWGAGDQLPPTQPDGARLLHRQRAATGSRNTTSTGCASTRCTRSRTRAGCDEMAATVRAHGGARPRTCTWSWNDHNDAVATCAQRGLSTRSGTTTAHHVLHVLLTGEDERLLRRLRRTTPPRSWRAAWRRASSTRASRRRTSAAARGEPSAHLPPTALVLFLQNHDQIGNRAFGERLTRAGRPGGAARRRSRCCCCARRSRCCSWARKSPAAHRSCSSPTSRAELADAVREGRRAEFARFPQFADPDMRARIPDPNAPRTFQDLHPPAGPGTRRGPRACLYQTLIALRQREIVPLLDGAPVHAEARAIGPKAVLARWEFGSGLLPRPRPRLITTLTPGDQSRRRPRARCKPPTGRLLFTSRTLPAGTLPGTCTAAWLDTQP